MCGLAVDFSLLQPRLVLLLPHVKQLSCNKRRTYKLATQSQSVTQEANEDFRPSVLHKLLVTHYEMNLYLLFRQKEQRIDGRVHG